MMQRKEDFMTDDLPRKQAAAYLKVEPVTLKMWAYRHKNKLKNSEKYGLKFYMVGGRAFYKMVDLESFRIRYPSI